MAITEDKGEDGQGVNLPKSTGAVEYQPPKDPEPITGDPAKSTGAVKYESPTIGNITNPDAENGGQAEVRVETPKEPVTMTTGWLSESQAKVVTQQHQEAARRSVQEPKKSDAAETPEDGRDVERKSTGDADDDVKADDVQAEQVADVEAKQAEAEADAEAKQADADDDDEFVEEDHPGGDDLPAGQALPPDEVSKKDTGRRRAPKSKDK